MTVETKSTKLLQKFLLN